jgi:thiosulfate dehydrogenase [quinone] large subunit
MEAMMSGSQQSISPQQGLTLFFRVAIGWVFLYAGITQLIDPHFTVAAFLSSTKTFHAVFLPLTDPSVAPAMTFVVEWGHTLIGLSLITGLFFRVGSLCGVMLMGIYYLAHMDFPYVESKLNFIMDYHLVYGAVLIYLITQKAGELYGLDGALQHAGLATRYPALRPLMG